MPSAGAILTFGEGEPSLETTNDGLRSMQLCLGLSLTELVPMVLSSTININDLTVK